MIVFFLTGFTVLLHAQAIDSAAIQEELQQLNNTRDSITRAQQEKEGLSIAVDPANEQEVTSEMQANFDRAMQQLDNENKILSKRILLITALVFIVMAGMRIILNKQEQKN